MVRRSWFRLGSLLLALAGLTSCAPGNPGLIVLNVVSPNGQCLFDTGNAFQSAGVLDVTGPDRGVLTGYTAAFRVGNQLINLSQSGTSGPPIADPNSMTIVGMEVELQDIAGSPLDLGGLPNPFSIPASGAALPSSDGSAVSEGLTIAEIVPLIYVDALRGSAGSQILAQVQAVGRTQGDAEVVSMPFSFPITLCTECLFGCARDEDEAPICQATCFPGQDGVQTTCTDIVGICSVGDM
ncbi:MAG: hypothetical protein AB8I08_35280 [Sandaracinaceae bacterium]